MTSEKKILLIALGGNALIKKGQKGTIKEQFANLKIPIRQIAQLSQTFRIIITHGNGPQVGSLLLQQENTANTLRMPLEILVAQTQGQIGYMIESTLDSELMALGIKHEQRFISLLSYVVVDENDPAFQTPTKPIGPIYNREEAQKLPYPTINTAKGYRRVVVSPKPVTIVEKAEIQDLIERDYIVICCGGGGIPVIRNGRMFAGVDAVIDKDLASAKLASEVDVHHFMIATDVDGVFLNFGQENQKLLAHMNIAQLENYIKNNQFPSGSMLPKVEACAQFIAQGGKSAVITSVNHIVDAMEKKNGTQITR